MGGWEKHDGYDSDTYHEGVVDSIWTSHVASKTQNGRALLFYF